MLRRNLFWVLALWTCLCTPALSVAQWTVNKVRPSARGPSAAFSPDGRSLAFLDGKGTIHVWNVATAKERKKITLALGPDDSAEQVLYTPNGDLAVLRCRYEGFKSGPGWARQGTIFACLWNPATEKQSPRIPIGYGGLAVCPKGDVLAYADDLWDIATGRKLRTVALPHGLVFTVWFSPDGKTVAYQVCESLAQDGSLVFFAEVATGKKLLQVGEFDFARRRLSFVTDAVFTPEGKEVACSATLYELASGKAVRKLSLEKHGSVIGFSPKGRSLISWDRSRGTVSLLEKRTLKELRAIKVGRNVEAVHLSPDGKTMGLIRGKAIELRRLVD
jgi:WD40 repeat protein